MRTIRNLVKTNENVWVYLGNEEICRIFYDMAEKEGFGFDELPREKWKTGKAVSVHQNGSMGHIPMFLWISSFTSGKNNSPEKIDFRKYIENDADSRCINSHCKAYITYR